MADRNREKENYEPDTQKPGKPQPGLFTSSEAQSESSTFTNSLPLDSGAVATSSEEKSSQDANTHINHNHSPLPVSPGKNAKPAIHPDWLSRSLQQLYQETVESPIPDSFKELLEKLDIAEKKTAR
ncbi:MAG: NepR family anti-sigma factor [Alphaproteobacteria bacterium]